MRARMLPWAFLAAWGMAGQTMAQTPNDFLTLQNGEMRDVRVLAVKADGIEYALPGIGGRIFEPFSNIARITYADRPADLDAAEHAVASRDWPEAVDRFQRALKAVDQRRCRRLHAEDALIGLSRACREAGQTDAALQACLRLLDEIPGSRYADEAFTAALQSAIASRNAASLKALEARARNPGLHLAAGLTDVVRGWRLFVEKRYEEARRLLERLAQDPETEKRSEVHAALIRCLMAGRRFDDARRASETALRLDGIAPGVRALACNVLGDLAWQRSADGQKPDLSHEALLHYLRTVILYPPEAGTRKDEYVRAMSRAARCFEALAPSRSDQTLREEYGRRARDLRDELARKYPESVPTPQAPGKAGAPSPSAPAEP